MPIFRRSKDVQILSFVVTFSVITIAIDFSVATDRA